MRAYEPHSAEPRLRHGMHQPVRGGGRMPVAVGVVGDIEGLERARSKARMVGMARAACHPDTVMPPRIVGFGVLHFPYGSCVIPVSREMLWECEEVGGQRGVVIDHAMRIDRQAGEHAGAAGRTEGVRASCRMDWADGAYVRGVGAAQVGPQIVADDEQDVGPGIVHPECKIAEQPGAEEGRRAADEVSSGDGHSAFSVPQRR